MPRRAFVVFNPASGRGRGAGRMDRYLSLLETHLPGFHHGITTLPGEESVLAEQALQDGFELIVAVGGDGTWGSVADRIIASGRDDVALGILAAGTGNDFGRNFGLSTRTPEDAVRTLAEEFAPTASQRRILRMNGDVVVKTRVAKATGEQFDLFSAYQRSRHNGGDMASMDFYDYQALVEETPVDSDVVEFRDGSGVLLAACLFDRMSDGLSAVYSFFDPAESRRSLGTYMILWMIGEARRLELPYLYLGYWIGDSPKMSYKAKFQPLEAYGAGGWAPFHGDGPDVSRQG